MSRVDSVLGLSTPPWGVRSFVTKLAYVAPLNEVVGLPPLSASSIAFLNDVGF